MSLLKKIGSYIIAGIVGIFAGFVLFFRSKKDSEIIENTPLDPLVENKEKNLDDINKELQKLDDEGVSDMSPEDVVDYWNRQ